MASTCELFDEDAVYKVNRKKFVDVGLVLENSEFMSSDEDSDEPNYPTWERMKKGHVRVAWHPNGVEEVLPERKVKLFDRSLMPGDVVRKLVKGKDTQLGYCRNTIIKADVQVVGTKQVIVGVNSKDLLPMEEFLTDVAVFKDCWVGMVKAIKTELTIRCADGSRCLMSDIDAFDMDDIMDRRERSSEFRKYSFYPGQQLWGPSYCFQKVKWLVCNKEMQDVLNKLTRNIRVTVEEVKIISLGIQWVCKAYSEDNITSNIVSEQPKFHVLGDDLKSIKMMNIFEPCTLQIGDRNYLVLQDLQTCTSITLNEWKNGMINRLNVESQRTKTSTSKGSQSPSSQPTSPKKTEKPPSTEEENAINGNCYNDSDFEDIDEEDDGMSSDTASITSHSTTSSVDRSKGVKQKSKKGPSLATKMLRKKKYTSRKRPQRRFFKEPLPLTPGDKVVTEALITETMAHVVWQDGTLETDIPSISLYPVHHLDGHEFFPGDYVVDNKDSRPHEYGVVKKVDHSGRTALITWMKTYHAGADPHPEILSEQEVSVYDIKDHPDFKYRPGSCVIRVANFEDPNPESTAGQVVDVHPTGKVEVSWVSGQMSLCYPQELYRVGEYDSDDLWAEDDSFCDEEDSWETESEHSLFGADECSEFEKDFEGSAKGLEKASLKLDDKEDDKSNEDMQEKLLANIEKLRAGMARLEEVFTQNPTLQTCNVMRRLLELYKHCKVLDQLLGTTYFHERHLQSLVERLKHRGRVNSIQHMTDQICRLFSFANDTTLDPTESLFKDAKEYLEPDNDTDLNEACKVGIDIFIEPPTGISSPDDILNEVLNPKSPPSSIDMLNARLDTSDDANNKKPLLSPLSPTSASEPRNICQQLCSILKSRLLKAHEDAEQRFGMPHSATLAMLAAECESQNEGSAEMETTESSDVKTAEKNEAGDVQSSEVEEVVEKTVCAVEQGEFSILDSVPDSHKYKLSIFHSVEPSAFFRCVKKEINILKSSLPEGIIVKSFEDRMDLYSVLIKGPKRTPYEDGLFFFDFQFPADYPKSPPSCHYISYCSDKLNPNLYEGGKVCVSLLGTWGGKGTEIWKPETSNLLQVIVSIQGLILVTEPYFNEAGYERQKGTQLGRENSRMYNEMVVLKLVQSMTKLLVNPPEVFKTEIVEHFSTQASKLIQRLEGWLTISESWNSAHPMSPTSPCSFKEIHKDVDDRENSLPEFPLIPASKGFCLTLRKSLSDFKDVITSSNIHIS